MTTYQIHILDECLWMPCLSKVLQLGYTWGGPTRRSNQFYLFVSSTGRCTVSEYPFKNPDVCLSLDELFGGKLPRFGKEPATQFIPQYPCDNKKKCIGILIDGAFHGEEQVRAALSPPRPDFVKLLKALKERCNSGGDTVCAGCLLRHDDDTCLWTEVPAYINPELLNKALNKFAEGL